jgi:hypothetical protein
VEICRWTFAPVEKPTRFLLPVLEEPGNDAGELKGLVPLTEELIMTVLRREDVDGGLSGSASGIDMVQTRCWMLEDSVCQ